MPYVRTKRRRMLGTRRAKVTLGAVAIISAATLTAMPIASRLAEPPPATEQAAAYDRTPPETTREPVTAYLIGDSVTGGIGGANKENDRYGNVMAERLNWALTTDAIGGTGYVAKGPKSTGVDARFITRLEPIIEENPDLVIVAGGRNDLFGPLEGFEASVDEFYTELRAGLPDAQIVVIAPWRWDTVAEERTVPLQAEKAAVLASAAESVDATFIDPPRDMPRIDDTNAPALLTEDDFHPNKDGNKLLGDALAKALVERGFPRGPEVWRQQGIADDAKFVDVTEEFFSGDAP